MRTATMIVLSFCMLACGGEPSESTSKSGVGVAGTSGAGAGGASGSGVNGDAASGGGWAPVAGISGAPVAGIGGGTGAPLAGTTGGMEMNAPVAGIGAGGDGAGGTMAGGTGGGAGGGAPSGPGCLQGSGNYMGDGPYRTASMDVTIGSSGPYTIFYPNPLDADCKHPLVAWGNGTAVTGSGTYGFYNTHAASWGVVVIASHNDNVGTGAFHRAGIDYMLAENDNPSSIFYQKLSGRVGTSGHSQGGMGANAGSSHPSVEAIVNVQGAFGRAPAGKAFLCLTGTADLNPAGCKSSVDGTSSPAMHANWQGGDHFGTATLAGFIGGDRGTRQYMRLYSAWFRCFLANDDGACAMFEGGASCPVCMDSGWAEIYAKNF